MTAGDWALCALYLAIWLAFTAWLIFSGRRELRNETALAQALHAYDQDIDQLMTAADLPPDEFEKEFREWERQQ